MGTYGKGHDSQIWCTAPLLVPNTRRSQPPPRARAPGPVRLYPSRQTSHTGMNAEHCDPPQPQVLAAVATRQVAQHIVVVIPAGVQQQRARPSQLVSNAVCKAQSAVGRHGAGCSRPAAHPWIRLARGSNCNSGDARPASLDDAQDEVTGAQLSDVHAPGMSNATNRAQPASLPHLMMRRMRWLVPAPLCCAYTPPSAQQRYMPHPAGLT